MPKVKVPMDFGVENLDNPTHGNIILKVAKGDEVKVSSLILSYNSKVFREMFKDKHCESVDLTEYSKSTVDEFVRALYSGRITLSPASQRIVWELAEVFGVKWLLKHCDNVFRYMIEVEMAECKFVKLRFVFEEAKHLKVSKNKDQYMLLALNKLNSMQFKVKQRFIKRYTRDYLHLTTEQLNLLIEVAGENGGGVLLQIINKNVISNSYTLDHNSRHILRNIDLAKCLESNMEDYDDLFNQPILSFGGIKELRRLDVLATNELLRRKPHLMNLLLEKRQGDVFNVTLNTLDTRTELNTAIPGPERRGERSVSYSPDEYPTTSTTIIVRKRVPPASNMSVKRVMLDPEIEDMSDNVSLEGTSRIPNLVYSIPDEFKALKCITVPLSPNSLYTFNGYVLDEVLELAARSNYFKNMYMCLEFIFLKKSITLPSLEPTDSDFNDCIKKLIELKRKWGWKKVSYVFINDLSRFKLKHSSHPSHKLLPFIRDCEDLTSRTEAAEIISQKGICSTLRSRKHYRYDTIVMSAFMCGPIKKYKFFWQHPRFKACSVSGRCGFVLCVRPISKSFDITLSTNPEDYTPDIHCHPEVLHTGDMHIALRRDYSVGTNSWNKANKSHLVYLTWNPKPFTCSNHVYWCDQHIPDNAYIALVVYYSFDI